MEQNTECPYTFTAETHTHQVHQSDVEEHTSSYGQYPGVGLLIGRAYGHSDEEPQHSSQGRDKVEEQGHVPAHPRGEKYEVVAQLVRDLMEDQGYHGAHSQGEALRDGCPLGQAIDKVVESIPHDDQPGQRLNAPVLPQLLVILHVQRWSNKTGLRL